MEDLMEKLQAMLSDEESMNQIKQLAGMFGGATSGAAVPNDGNSADDKGSVASSSEMPDLSALFSAFGKGNSKEESKSSGIPDLGIDLGMIMQLQGLLQSVSCNDKNADLLVALKPHLKEEKQGKVDKAVKLLKLFALWTVIKESGILKSFDLF